jgi:glycosyltransferase involved in cell wall biosynthesis
VRTRADRSGNAAGGGRASPSIGGNTRASNSGDGFARALAVNRRRLRVLTLLDSPAVSGGGERMATSVAMAVDGMRFDRYLCATRPASGATYEPELRSAGVEVLTLARRSKTDLAAWKPLVSFLRRIEIDILHAHKFGSNIWGTVLGRALRVPVVIAHEQSWASARYEFGGERMRAFLDRELIGRGADAFIAVSRADRRRMIDFEGIDPARVRVFWNAVPRQVPTGDDVRADFRIAPDAPVVLTVSQLRPEKALDVLVGATAVLKAEFPAVRVLVAGDGPEREALRTAVKEAGLDEHVLLLGTRRDVPDLLEAADVAVCCSDFEGTPLSVMEYMAAGKPVVATNVGGLPELVDSGVSGLLVEPRDVQGLAAAIGTLLRDPSQARSMGAHAQARQRRDFDLETTTRRLEALYEDLFRSTSRARSERWAPVVTERRAR